MDPKRHPNFKLIQKYWYERLIKDGFEDAEEEVKGEVLLKRYTLVRIRNDNNEKCENNRRFDREAARAKFNYVFYTLCRQFIWTPEFKAILEKHPDYGPIWEMYSEGTLYDIIVEKTGRKKRFIRY